MTQQPLNPPDPASLRIVRHVPGLPDRVWRAWTDPAELTAWFWPESFDTTVEIDLRIGGRYRIASAVAGMAVSGEFVALDAPNRLVQTWRWDGEDAETLVTTQFRAVAENRTEIVVVHERFGSDEDCRSHRQGWNDCLDRLETHAVPHA